MYVWNACFVCLFGSYLYVGIIESKINCCLQNRCIHCAQHGSTSWKQERICAILCVSRTYYLRMWGLMSQKKTAVYNYKVIAVWVVLIIWGCCWRLLALIRGQIVKCIFLLVLYCNVFVSNCEMYLYPIVKCICIQLWNVFVYLVRMLLEVVGTYKRPPESTSVTHRSHSRRKWRFRQIEIQLLWILHSPFHPPTKNKVSALPLEDVWRWIWFHIT